MTLTITMPMMHCRTSPTGQKTSYMIECPYSTLDYLTLASLKWFAHTSRKFSIYGPIRSKILTVLQSMSVVKNRQLNYAKERLL